MKHHTAELNGSVHQTDRSTALMIFWRNTISWSCYSARM